MREGSGATQTTAMKVNHGGANGGRKEVPVRSRETEGRGAAGGEESRGGGWWMTNQSRAGRIREPGGAGELMGDSGEVGEHEERKQTKHP